MDKQHQEIYLINKSQKKKCPKCGNKYSSEVIEYRTYDSKNNFSGNKKISVKRCVNCRKSFITEDTYKTNFKGILNSGGRTDLNFKNIEL